MHEYEQALYHIVCCQNCNKHVVFVLKIFRLYLITGIYSALASSFTTVTINYSVQRLICPMASSVEFFLRRVIYKCMVPVTKRFIF